MGSFNRSLLKSGYLSKRSVNARLGRWNRHFFTLDDKRALCYYYFSPSNPTTAMLLKGVFVITHDSKILSGGRYGEQCLVLQTPYATVVLRAERKDKREEWVRSLSSVITEAKLASKAKDYSSKNSITRNNNKLREMRRQAELKKLPQKLHREDNHIRFNTQQWTVSGNEFELDAAYELKKVIGNGAYGVVVSADNTKTSADCAIKKIGKVFGNVLDTKRILREIRLLRILRHPNIAHIIDLMRPAPEIDQKSGRLVNFFEDVYLVMERMDTDLQRVINSEQLLGEVHIKFILCQLLEALVYLESAQVVHRDLKPSNILINSKCQIRVADFGLARSINIQEKVSAEENDMTTYVVTRWYRAPELILASGDYSSKLDVWAAGCIFGELICRTALFQGGDFLDQMEKITDVLGTPKREEMVHIDHGSASNYMNSIMEKGKPKKDWAEVLAHEIAGHSNEELLTPECFGMLDVMLAFGPSFRASPEEALRHEFLKDTVGQDPDFWKKLRKSDIVVNMQQIENAVLDEQELRNAVLQEISYFREYK